MLGAACSKTPLLFLRHLYNLLQDVLETSEVLAQLKVLTPDI